MTGYYNQPEENAKAFTADGFMRTGDIGIIDAQGYTRIIDRKKDMILVSGFNVFPNELEQVISLCPGVVECAADWRARREAGRGHQGVHHQERPRPDRGRCGSVLPRKPHRLQAPQYIEFRDDLPKTNVGKNLAAGAAQPHRVMAGEGHKTNTVFGGPSQPSCAVR